MAPKGIKMGQKGQLWTKLVQNGSNWAKNGPKWVKIGRYWTERVNMGQNEPVIDQKGS